MNKKLPSVYVNVQNEPIDNNQRSFYSKNALERNEKKEISHVDKLKIRKRISELFESPKFVYKLPVIIETETGEKLNEVIVAKKGNSLVTLENKQIDINKILNIEEK